MRRIIAAFAGLVIALVMSLPAQAATGLFSQQEAMNVCFTAGGSCDGADSQADVETKCNCTGDKVGTWTSGGTDYKQINYNNSYEVGGVQAIYRDGGAHWRIVQITWCNGSGCNIYF